MPGSYSIAGQEVELRAKFSIEALGQSYSISGQSLGIKFSLGQGTYSKTGQEARLQFLLSIEQGSYSQAGQNVSLIDETGSRNYRIRGQDVTLRFPTSLSAGQGAYSEAGQDGRYDLGHVLRLAGNYVLSGQPPDFIAPPEIQIAADRGIYGITGQNAHFRLGGVSGQGAFTQTGQFNLLDSDIVLLQAIYPLTGQAVVFTATGPSAGEGDETYLITGQDQLYRIAFKAGQGTHTIVGQDVDLDTIGQEVVFQTEHGTYTLTLFDVGPKSLNLSAEQALHSVVGQDVLFVIGVHTDQGTYYYRGMVDAEQGTYGVAGQDVDLRIFRRPIVSSLADDYPWEPGEETDAEIKRKKTWKEQLVAKERLRRTVIDAVEGLEARAEARNKEAAKTLRQVRSKYTDEEGLLDFRKMLDDELKPIRKLLAEYAGRDFAQKALDAYQSQLDTAAQQEEEAIEELMAAYDQWEVEHVKTVTEAVKGFTTYLEKTVKSRSKRTLQ